MCVSVNGRDGIFQDPYPIPIHNPATANFVQPGFFGNSTTGLRQNWSPKLNFKKMLNDTYLCCVRFWIASHSESDVRSWIKKIWRPILNEAFYSELYVVPSRLEVTESIPTPDSLFATARYLESLSGINTYTIKTTKVMSYCLRGNIYGHMNINRVLFDFLEIGSSRNSFVS